MAIPRIRIFKTANKIEDQPASVSSGDSFSRSSVVTLISAVVNGSFRGVISIAVIFLSSVGEYLFRSFALLDPPLKSYCKKNIRSNSGFLKIIFGFMPYNHSMDLYLFSTLTAVPSRVGKVASD